MSKECWVKIGSTGGEWVIAAAQHNNEGSMIKKVATKQNATAADYEKYDPDQGGSRQLIKSFEDLKMVSQINIIFVYCDSMFLLKMKSMSTEANKI